MRLTSSADNLCQPSGPSRPCIDTCQTALCERATRSDIFLDYGLNNLDGPMDHVENSSRAFAASAEWVAPLASPNYGRLCCVVVELPGVPADLLGVCHVACGLQCLLLVSCWAKKETGSCVLSIYFYHRHPCCWYEYLLGLQLQGLEHWKHVQLASWLRSGIGSWSGSDECSFKSRIALCPVLQQTTSQGILQGPELEVDLHKVYIKPM